MVLQKISPAKVAFMHLDLNNLAAEIGALELLFQRLVPGWCLSSTITAGWAAGSRKLPRIHG